MDRDMSNRRGFFQPGTDQNVVLKKKPTVAEVLSNLVTVTGPVQSSSASANMAAQVAQKISVQKETAVKEAAAAQQKTVAAQNNAPKFGRFARENITEYINTQVAKEATKAAAKTASAIKTSQVNYQVIGGNTRAPETTYYDVDPTLNAMYKEAVAQGVKVNAPAVYGQSVKTEAAAKAAQQTYIDYLDKQYAAYNNAQPVTVYDDLGRSQSVSQSQLAQMEKAQQTRKISGTYTVLPEEVANSKANWWINSNGLYEWTPVTAGDKAELARQNKQRAQFHQAPKTTLTCGASPSEEYSAQWYSTGGNRTQVARNAKLANLKASSSVNNSSSAKSNTAQTKKATVVSAATTAKQQAAAQAKRKVEATQAVEAAKKAEALAAQTKLEAAAKAKQLTVARAELRKAVSAADKTAAQKTVKALEKESTAAKDASKAASNHAKATSELASATKTAAKTSVKKTPTVINAVNKAQAKAKKTAAASKKAGVQDHTGQILLKDGTWINQVQKKGIAGKGASAVKVFGTTEEYQKQLAADYKNKLAGKSTAHTLNPVYEKALIDSRKAKAAELTNAKRIAAAYVPILAATGEIIDAIQVKNLHGTGEAGVRVIKLDKNNNVIAASKTAKQFLEEKNFFNKAVKVTNSDGSITKTTLDNLPITSQTNKATAKLIQEARDYKLAHTTNVNKKALKTSYTKKDNAQARLEGASSTSAIEKNISSKISAAGSWLEKHSKKDTAASRNAAQLKALATGDLSANVLAISNNFMAVSNRGLSSAISPVFERLDYVNDIANSAFAGTSISINDKGKIFVDRKGAENKNSKVVYNAKDLKDNSKTVQLASKGYNYVKNKPASALVDVGKAYVGGAAFGTATKAIGLGASSGLFKVSEKLGTGIAAKATHAAAFQTERAVNLAMLGTLVLDANELRKEGNYEDVAKTLVTLSIGGLGYKRGERAGIKAIDTLRKIGKTPAPIEAFVRPEILSGKEMTPMIEQGTPVRKTIAAFRDPKTGENIGYHVSPSQIFPKVRSKVSRPSDQAGLYVSPVKSGASIYFARAGEVKTEISPFSSLFRNTSDLVVAVQGVTKKDITATAKTIVARTTGKSGNYPNSVIKLKQTVKETPGNVMTSLLGGSTPLPTVNRIHLNKVQRMPEGIRHNLKKTQAAMDKASPGEAFITYKFERNIKVGKAEAEATLTPGTILKKLKSDRYFEYNGRVVTLNEYKALEGKGRIKKGEMGKRELSASQKKELVKNYATKKSSKRLKSSSSSGKAVSRGLKVPRSSLKSPKSSKTYAQKSVKSSYRKPVSSRKGSSSSSGTTSSRRSSTTLRSVVQSNPLRKSTTSSRSGVSSRKNISSRKSVTPSRKNISSRKSVTPSRKNIPSRKSVTPSRKNIPSRTDVTPSRKNISSRKSVTPSRKETPSKRIISTQYNDGNTPWYLEERVRKGKYTLGKVSKGTTKKKVNADRLKFHRDIKNTLGSIGSFFGDSPLKKSPAKARNTKTTTKKRTAVKRGKR